ncbi:dihydrolipoyllysine-residue acetyltransferase [Hydrogenophaga sp. 5NK40-0174]|uniref:dihydrolipoyllysine-residue acetyltransferase n=1 Tax=Hydrogenophaga sp. 5NK40-0174 TaxID=3127649 RepID=UPI00310C5C84
MATIEIKVPDIGDFSDVAVIEVLVQPGDTVKAEQSLVTVESDKASMEIPCSHAGVVKELKVKLGDTVSEGSVLLMLDSAESAAEAPAPAPAATTPAPAPAPAAASPAAMPAAAPAQADGEVEVKVPDIGDFADVAVIEVLVQPGDEVQEEQSLITVESDKASMEIPSSAAGTVVRLAVKVGDKVNMGDLVAVLSGAAGSTTSPAPAAAAPASAPSAAAAPAPAAAVSNAQLAAAHQPATAQMTGLPHASPSVRKFARELGVPLAEVKGSGAKDRITREDIENFTRAVMAGQQSTKAQQSASSSGAGGANGAALGLIPWPKVDFAKFGPVERKELSRIKKISGANLLRNAVMIPAVTNHDDADITDLEALRVQLNKENEKKGIKVTMLAFLIKACVAALKKFPEFNSSLDVENDSSALIYKNYWHIGFAADTPNGLVVPVIKNADEKGVFEISKEMSELAAKARDGKLGPADMSGATFTISSLGGIGGRYFTPIINAPEVAILGVCRSQMEPVWDGKEFKPRLMLPLSLTWDHRVIDGAAAARFNAYLGQILADFRRVML